MQAKEQKENRVKKSYGSTQDLETAATVFKFAADHTTVEWKLDVYDDNGTRTAVVATDRDPYGQPGRSISWYGKCRSNRK